MNQREYEKVKDLSYDDYCNYLREKYGIPEKSYFSEGFKRKNKIGKSHKGLYCHHVKEMCAVNLSDWSCAIRNPYEFQSPENLVYCDLLEHFLLHLLIVEDKAKNPVKHRNDNGDVGIGGIVTFFIPELNDVYSSWYPKKSWKQRCINKVKRDKNVYTNLVSRLIKNYYAVYYDDIFSFYDEIFTSANGNSSRWSPEKNIEIYKEILEICKFAGINNCARLDLNEVKFVVSEAAEMKTRKKRVNSASKIDRSSTSDMRNLLKEFIKK